MTQTVSRHNDTSVCFLALAKEVMLKQSATAMKAWRQNCHLLPMFLVPMGRLAAFGLGGGIALNRAMVFIGLAMGLSERTKVASRLA